MEFHFVAYSLQNGIPYCGYTHIENFHSNQKNHHKPNPNKAHTNKQLRHKFSKQTNHKPSHSSHHTTPSEQSPSISQPLRHPTDETNYSNSAIIECIETGSSGKPRTGSHEPVSFQRVSRPRLCVQSRPTNNDGQPCADPDDDRRPPPKVQESSPRRTGQGSNRETSSAEESLRARVCVCTRMES